MSISYSQDARKEMSDARLMSGGEGGYLVQDPGKESLN